MAKQQGPRTVASKDEVTVLTDIHGNTVMEIGKRQYTIHDSQGGIIHRQITQCMQTVDNVQWDPTMRFSRPPIHVGICQQCRDGVSLLKQSKSHGIVTLPGAKLCMACGTLCCPSHRKLGRDQRWRCLKHHRLHLLYRTVLRPIFFERSD
ncbi:hypothetical protein ACFL6U_23370 [Planctomycetota bacterium]